MQLCIYVLYEALNIVIYRLLHIQVNLSENDCMYIVEEVRKSIPED